MVSLRDHLRAQADREVQRIEKCVRGAYGHFEPDDRAEGVARFETFFTAHPQRRATRRGVAVRQAGCFVLSEASGLRVYTLEFTVIADGAAQHAMTAVAASSDRRTGMQKSSCASLRRRSAVR
jgi:hypothetical protein